MLLFQSESKCETILMKITSIFIVKMKLHAELIFMGKVCAVRLVLKQRYKRARKMAYFKLQLLESVVSISQNLKKIIVC